MCWVAIAALERSFLVRLLNLDHKCGEGIVAGYKHLVGNAGGDVGKIAGAEFNALASLDGSAANLAGGNRMCAGNGSASDQRGPAIENDEEVCEALMLLGDAVAAAHREHGGVAWVFLESFRDGTLGIGGRFAQVCGALHQDGAAPMMGLGGRV